VELEALDVEDKLTVRALIEKHIRLTGSEHAKRILENFEREAKHFIKVMPTDYKRVLSEKKLRHVVQVPELRAQAAV
jgi:glutamate synthase domain-containing protein 3